MAPSQAMMSAPLLLLAVVLPVVVGLTFPDGPRAYYVAQAWLVAILLLERRHAGGQACLYVAWLGAGVQLLAIIFGIWTEAGALDNPTLILVLAATVLVAEVVARFESNRCQKTKP